MKSQPPGILLIGDHQHRELAEPVAWLSRHTQLTLAASVAHGLQAGPHFQGVVLAQTRPGQIAGSDVDRISQAYPLARLIALLGSWCEGETRTGKPWPGVTRVYWHQWRAGCDRELRFGGDPTAWQLPRTSTEVERALYALLRPPPSAAGKLAVFTRRASLYRALSDACTMAGYQTTWIRRSQDSHASHSTAILWDGGAGEEHDFAQLQELVAVAAPARVVALMGFPRFDDVQRARLCGAADLLAVPLQLPDLWSVLQRLTSPPRRKDSSSAA